jgi:hypothetical protein
MDRHDDLVGVAARLMLRELLDLARIYKNANAWGRAPMEGARNR